MTKKDREKKFVAAAQRHPLCTDNAKIAQGYGASNALMVVDSGLELLDADLDRVKPDQDSFLLLAGAMLPPKDELYVAVYIKEDAERFYERLKVLREIGEAQKNGDEDALKYPLCNINNNNCAIIVTWEDGKIYIRNTGHWNGDAHTINLHSFEPAISADRIAFAVYPPNRDAARSLNVRTYISYIARLFRQDKIHEIHPWDTSEADFESYKVDIEGLDLADLRGQIRALGNYYPDAIVNRFHLALNYLPNKHFVILAGLSGTGKTSLVIRYAQAVHGIKSPEEKDPFLFMCRVRPDWTDPTGLVGYHDIITNRYVVPEFLEAMLTAHAYPNIPVVVCLDEMNLARVEYYFSDILSCIESAPESHVGLHHDSVPMEGSNGEDIPSSIPMPSNLYVVGTINVDETTSPLSDKVLDRATVIDMTTIDLDGFLVNLQTREPVLAASISDMGPIFKEISTLLAEQNMGFGYRLVEESVRYHDFAANKSGDDSTTVIDHLLAQKILTKLRGTERQRNLLEKLKVALKDFPNTSATIDRLMEELNEIGGFQAVR